MENIISVQNVSFHYVNDYTEDNAPKEIIPVLEGLSLDIKKGEFTAILGHNGCGKSTLAKLFNAVLVPNEGKVISAGYDTSDESHIFDIRQHVGMVFQNPDNQIVATIVEEDVAFALENMGVPADEMRRRVDNALKAVDMYDYREHSPHQLSGGQKQRVAIAGIIAMHPDCIVLDEPTAMLDPKGRKKVMETVKTLCSEHNITIVLITHYMDEAALADRVVVMDKGKIVMDGKPRDVFSHVREMKALGLDVPQVTELMFRLGGDTHIIGEEECVRAIIKLLK